MRAHVKSIVETLALYGGPASISRARSRGDCIVLAFHNVVPDSLRPAGERSLHLQRSKFADFLDVLTDLCDVVSLDEVLPATVESFQRSRPRAAITFDDAYEGALTCGLEELTARGLPATYFVAPAYIGGGTFWWDVLAEAHGGALPEPVRTRALTVHGGIKGRILGELPPQKCDLPDPLRGSAEKLLSDASRHAGITFASHTWDHPNLCALQGEELSDELSNPLNWLMSRYGNVRRWLSYPYGLSNRTVQQAVEHAGYASAFAISGGWLRADGGNGSFELPRLNVPAGLTWKGLALRVSGLSSR